MPAPDSAASPDVLVIGGGVAGLFCAHYLRQAGRTVTVVERGAVGGATSCSYGNTGFVGTQGSAPLAEPGLLAAGLGPWRHPDAPLHVAPGWDAELLSWLRNFRRAGTEHGARDGFRTLLTMKQRSLAILTELCASGPLAGTFTEGGMLLAYRSPDAFDRACRGVPHAVANGVPLRVLAPGEITALEPTARFEAVGAVFNPEGAHLDMPAFTLRFAEALRSAEVEIHEQAEVIGFEVGDRSVTQVRTTRGDFRPGEVVLAAGAWSTACARKLNIGLALQPIKGYSVTVAMPPNAPRRPVLFGEERMGLTPLGDRLRFGGTMELAGLDGSLSARRIDGMRRTVRAYLPELAETETVETWSGFRPCTPDSLPYIGRAEAYRNVSVACGHGHIGLGLAPVGGRILAQILTGEAPEMDVMPMRVDRYGGS